MREPSFHLKDYLRCVASLDPLGPEELQRQAMAMLQGDPFARRVLEERCLPRVVAWLVPYRGASDMPFLKLLGIGNRALLRAARAWRFEDGDFEDYTRRHVEESVETALGATR